MNTQAAARLLHKSDNFVRIGLQTGRLPIGYAVKTGSRWNYYIDEKKVEEITNGKSKNL